MFQDDRRNFKSAADAALAFLQVLNRHFGDFNLSLAAYNFGAGCIDKSRARSKSIGKSGRFEDLKLNAETANYVPKLHALARIIANPEKYGITLPTIDNTPNLVTVRIDRDMDVSVAAQMARLTLKEFNLLNPQHNKPLIVAATNREVLLPLDRKQTFIESLRDHHGPLKNGAQLR